MATWIKEYLERRHGARVENNKSESEWCIRLPEGEVHVLTTHAAGERIGITIWAFNKALPTAEKIANDLIAKGVQPWDLARGFRFVKHE
jgi:hypothetical protein